MNLKHVITEPGQGDLGFGCSCGQRFALRKLADKHAEDQNLIQANEMKADLQRQADHAAPAETPQEAADDAKDEETTFAPVKALEAPIPQAVGSQPASAAVTPVQPPAEAPQQPAQALGPASLPLDLNNMSLNQINFIGQVMAKSGMFPDVTDASKALVKILAGQEIGITPFQAMTSIHIIQGKATMGAHLMAAKVKGSGKYDLGFRPS